MKNRFRSIRKDYNKGSLSEALSKAKFDPNPIKQFSKWFKKAIKVGVDEPNAMALATSTKKGKPSVRFVLLKGIDASGFCFYTNYKSRKGNELSKNSQVACSIYWPELAQQVRIEGRVAKLTDKESNEYFYSRPRGAQISAWVSKQSRVVRSREQLISETIKYEEKFKIKNVPRPEYWGGYRIIPNSIEFWQGQKNRLHDRILYRLRGRTWKVSRLSP